MAALNLYYPRSFFQLILIGFSLVALPLVLALVNNALQVERLAQQSRDAVYQAAQATRASRLIVEQLTAMERAARQYLILGDESLLAGYEKTHHAFEDTAAQLSSLLLDAGQQTRLADLVEKERKLFNSFHNPPQGADTATPPVWEFATLASLAQDILQASNRLVEREAEALQQRAGEARRVLAWQLLAVIPVATGLVAWFTLLISRPIRQIEHAIRRLGDGEWSAAVVVNGPKDLEQLGRSLDWMRMRFIELEDQKNKFLRHVSHELKTPLTAIREGVSLLHDEVAGALAPEQQEITRILEQNILQLQRLIEDLLNYSGAKLRELTVEIRPVALAAVVDRVINDHRLAIMAKNLKLDARLERVTVEGDAEQLRVVVDNLLSNAIKHSPEGGTIGLVLKCAAGRAVLDVRDSGPGIDSEDQERIFDAFYQGKTAAQGYIKGTGLGLSIVKEYVTGHGGTVEVVEREHKGAHFRVTLPAANMQEADEG